MEPVCVIRLTDKVTDKFTDVADISLRATSKQSKASLFRNRNSFFFNIEARRYLSSKRSAFAHARLARARELSSCHRLQEVLHSRRGRGWLGEISQVTREVTLQPRRTPA